MGRDEVSMLRLPLLALLSVLFLGQTAAAVTIWSFDLPATGVPSLNPPYPTVATLTLTQTADGVQFVLDPNEGSPGFADHSFIERIDYVYAGSALSDGDFRHDAGAPAEFSFLSNPNNVDAGYKADVFHIVVDFPSKNDPDRFNPGDTSTWTVLGTSLSDFDGTFASANNKATPIHGVLRARTAGAPHLGLIGGTTFDRHLDGKARAPAAGGRAPSGDDLQLAARRDIISRSRQAANDASGVGR
jgi:hypothetical protein